MTRDELELVQRILAGDRDDFRVIVERHQQAMFRFVWGLVGSREEAHDLVQEVFLAAYTNLARFDASRASLATWLFTIARNRSINWLKRNRTAPLSAPEAIQDAPAADPLTQRELAQQLDAALAALPLEQRMAFVLAEIEELPYAEIARIEQTTLGTVKSRIHRAKQRLQSILKPAVRESP